MQPIPQVDTENIYGVNADKWDLTDCKRELYEIKLGPMVYIVQ
jgi:hypothetical protein